MSSRFAWIDVDEGSRRTMLDFIDQFRDQGILDEIGIGIIRDAFADYFFPGTTTVQTRARYFLFVPWIYRQLESKKTPSADFARKLRAAELRLLEAMLDAGVGEGERLIGRQSKAALKRWPSSIYWAGLRTWRICCFLGSQERYRRWLDTFYRQRRSSAEEIERELGDEYSENWDSNLPKVPPEFPDKMTMDLEREDAEYLVQQIRIACPGSLLASLLSDASALDADAIWTLPNLTELSDKLQEQIQHARMFAEVMHGASLLYYWSAASMGQQAKRTNEAEKLLNEWAMDIAGDWPALIAWVKARKQFWESPAFLGVKIPDRTRRFVEAWTDHIVDRKSAADVWKSEPAVRLIKERERETKPEVRARLWNRQQLERWDPSGAPTLLDYRWSIASELLSDIQDGLIAKRKNETDEA